MIVCSSLSNFILQTSVFLKNFMTFNPFGVVRKIGVWTSAGFVDRFTGRCTGCHMNFGKRVASKLDDCAPWTDHIEASSLVGIEAAVRDRDFTSARFLLAIGQKSTAVTACINVAELAINLLAEGHEITFDLYTSLE
jgi:hypothetical protein